MDPALVVFLIRAGIRVGHATAAALEQWVRDADFEMPGLRVVGLAERVRMRALFARELASRVAPGGDLADLWDPQAESGLGGPVGGLDSQAERRLLEVARAHWKQFAGPVERSVELEPENLRATLRQWKEGEGPPAPWVRVALSLAEVGLEFAQVRPDAFGVGGDGEKVVRAVAAEIQVLLPDADDPTDWKSEDWSRFYFAERTLSILLRAGLRTLNSHPDLVTDEAHLEDLVRNTTAPMLKSFEGNPDRQLDFLRLQETLLGPVAQAAFATLAKHQTAFLGQRFGPEQAAGAVTAAVLDVAQQEGISGLAEDGTLYRLADAVIGVAAERPELFLGDSGKPEMDLARGALSSVAKVLVENIDDSGIHLSKDLLTDLGVATLDVVAEKGPKLFDSKDPWQQVAASTVTHVARALSDGLGEDGVLEFEKLFSRQQAVELVRVVLAQAARTPGMLTGNGNPEVQAIVGAVAQAMAADEKLLLAADDWQKIAAVAAEEAARNPGRLFGLDPAKPEHRLGAAVIQNLLTAAAESFGADGVRSGPLAFGDTLTEAIVVALRASAGNLESALKAVGLVQVDGASLDNFGELLRAVDDFARNNRGRVGSREWLWLFRSLVARAIDEAGEFEVTTARLEGLMKESAAAGGRA